MNTYYEAQSDLSLTEMLGTFLQVSAPSAPESLSLREAAGRFHDWALRQPVVRLNRVYDHLTIGKMDPQWDELGLEGGNS